MVRWIVRSSWVIDLVLRPLGLWLVYTLDVDDATGRLAIRGVRICRRVDRDA